MKQFVYLFLSVLLTFSCTSKDKVDPCENVTCNNGGKCINGDCDCPENYTGTYCDEEVTPQYVTITGFQMNDWPYLTSTGGYWDFLDAADPYLQIETQGGNVLYQSPVNNDLANAPKYWSFNAVSYAPSTAHYIRLYDRDDFGADQLMATIQIVPYQKNLGFPTKVDVSGPVMRGYINLEYTW